MALLKDPILKAAENLVRLMTYQKKALRKVQIRVMKKRKNRNEV